MNYDLYDLYGHNDTASYEMLLYLVNMLKFARQHTTAATKPIANDIMNSLLYDEIEVILLSSEDK